MDAKKNRRPRTPQQSDSWWNRKTDGTNGTTRSTIIYAVSDKGFVQAAVLFSFIMPGLGQTYNGHYLKGTFLLLAGFALAWGFGVWGLSILFLGAVEALISARRIVNGDSPRPVADWPLFVHILLGAYLMLFLVYITPTIARIYG